MPAAARRTRLCIGLTMAGGTLLIAGFAVGIVGETTRLTGGRGWHSPVAAAEILIAAGLLFGAVLLICVIAWNFSLRWPLAGNKAADAIHAAASSYPPVAAHQGRAPRAAMLPVPSSASSSHERKMTQIKDLYREAGEMGDAELSARWDELRRRQRELIREYFEQAGLVRVPAAPTSVTARGERRRRGPLPR